MKKKVFQITIAKLRQVGTIYLLWVSCSKYKKPTWNTKIRGRQFLLQAVRSRELEQVLCA